MALHASPTALDMNLQVRLVLYTTNNSGARASDGFIGGFYNGLYHSEHAVLSGVDFGQCKVAVWADWTFHLTTYQNLSFVASFAADIIPPVI